MNNTRPYWKVVVSLVFSFLATVLVIVIGVSAIRFLAPFVIGWLIACLANPVVCWLNKKINMKKKFGSALMIVLVLGAVIGLVYLMISCLVKELGSWILSLPDLYHSITVELQEVTANLSDIFERLPQGLRETGNDFVLNIGNALANVVADLSEPTVVWAGDIAKQIPSLLIGTFVAILSAYFFVADRESFVAWVRKATPKAIFDRLSMAVSHFKHAVGGYFIAQFKIMLVICIILFVGLSLLKVEYAIILSILIGFLDFLPFFGTGTAFVPWCIYSLLTGEYMRALFLLIIYIITQVVHHLIQPKLIGDEVGLNPLPTLFFLYLGYKLGGFIWMILAVPLGIIVIKMYQAGAFDYILNDVKILIKGIKSLRE